jgi:hypothetical protein
MLAHKVFKAVGWKIKSGAKRQLINGREDSEKSASGQFSMLMAQVLTDLVIPSS